MTQGSFFFMLYRKTNDPRRKMATAVNNNKKYIFLERLCEECLTIVRYLKKKVIDSKQRSNIFKNTDYCIFRNIYGSSVFVGILQLRINIFYENKF